LFLNLPFVGLIAYPIDNASPDRRKPKGRRVAG